MCVCVFAVKVKAHELRMKGRDDLVRQLDELKTGAYARIAQIHAIRLTLCSASCIHASLCAHRAPAAPCGQGYRRRSFQALENVSIALAFLSRCTRPCVRASWIWFCRGDDVRRRMPPCL